MKKQLQLIIIIVLLASLTGYGQNVGDSFTVDDITYEITSPSSDPTKPHTSTGKVKVVDYEGTAEEVTIPTKVNDQGIDYRVTAIGNDAFSGHGKAEEDKLTSVDMPHTVISIGDSAFRDNKLTEVVIPLSVNSIGASAFQDNPDLKTVIVRSFNAPNLVNTNPFSNLDRSQIDLLVPTDREEHYSNRGWTGFKSPGPKPGTFKLSDGITYAITSVVQGEGEVKIVDFDASAASSATGVIIPQTVTDQGTDYKVTAIGYRAFHNKQLTQVTFSNTPSTPSNVTSIGEDAFWQNELNSVVIPESVTSLGQRAFGTNQLTGVTIPNRITNIRQWAFAVNGLTEVTIPDNVDNIEYQAFYGNNNLKLVMVERNDPPVLDATAFQGTRSDLRNQIDVVVPEDAIDEYKDPANGWTGFKSITIGTFTDNRIKYVISSSSPPEVEITDYDNDNGTATVVNIPSEVSYKGTDYEVTAIGNVAFRQKELTSVTFADQSNVTRIDSAAFAHNTLTELTIPSSVTSIGERAFWINLNKKEEGNGLTRLTFADQSKLKVIERYAFMNNNLTEVTIPGSLTRTEPDIFSNNELTQVNFSTSGNLKSINEGVFKGNKLTSVTIPDGVTSIGNSAFSRNDGLTQVTLPGSVSSIDIYAFSRYIPPTSPPPLLVVSLEATTPPSLALNSDGTGDPFGDRSLIAVDVPRSALEDYHAENDWTGFRSIGIFTDKDIKYGITDVTTNEVMVLDYTGSAAGVDIPGTVNDNNKTYTVTSIGQQAFKDNQLTGVTLPGGVTRIDSIAFMDNPNLAMVTVDRYAPPELHADAFQDPDRDQIDVIVPRGTPAGSIKTAYEAAEWTNFASITEGIELLIEGAPSETESLSPFDMTFNFIREVTGFTIDDISVDHATLSDFTGDGSSYTVKVTPTTCDGIIEITVPENVAEYTSNFPNLEASATIAVNATPSAPSVSSSPVEYCVDETATALTATGDNLLWYTSGTGGTGEATAPIPGTATAGSTTHYVSQTTNGCESERAEIVVIVEACPAQTGDVFTVSGMDYEITSVDPYTVTVIGINDTNTAGRSSETQTISVTIPETVTYKEITYTVTAVGANAFNDNPDLDRVTVEATHPPSLHENALTGRGQIDLIVPAGTREDYLKEGWTGFRSITLGIFTGKDIKYGITAVTPNEVMVLDYIGSATAVEIPGTVDDNGETYTVTAVGANAFSDNPDLATVKMEATHPLALHENAFADRSKINLIVPAGTREDYLKEGWTGFASITEEKVVTAIRNHEFNDFTLYPNPARDKVHIDIDPRSGQELKQVNIYTMNGACLHSENGPVINTGRLPRGTYLFEIVTKKGDRSMKKVIIQ